MLKQFVGMIIAILVIGSSSSAFALTSQQQAYLDARTAQKQGNKQKYQQLRKQLSHYPLTLYLDYHDQQTQITQQSGTVAKRTLSNFKNTPLFNNLKHKYLLAVGKRKRWRDFLAVSPTLPKNTELQCYFYRARLQQGKKQIAWSGAKNLWLHGYSQPKACDILFSQWAKAGQRTQSLIWQRMLLAFDAGQFGLLSWLSRKITSHKRQAEALIKVYRDPRQLRHTRKFLGNHSYESDLVYAGLMRLAKVDLKQALRLFKKYKKSGRFSERQAYKLNKYIVRRALIKQQPLLAEHVDSALATFRSDDLTEMRLRWAIRDGDQAVIKQTLPLLSEQAADTSRWQFWQARFNNDPKQRHAALSQAAKQRNFYGFLAANLIGNHISLNNTPPKTDAKLQRQLANDPAWLRILELQALDKHYDARVEWRDLLARVNHSAKTQYTLMAGELNWHAMGVEGTIQSKLWDHISQRFPLAYNTDFNRASQKHHLNPDELRAIARRESAYYPRAISSAGARGLMQLMPSTAKQTARQHKINYRKPTDLYKIDLNIKLGSAYYASLLRKFDDNRILATAAYNAGPHRVSAWLKRTDGNLDALAFIESIPYRETREYVQAVLSYRLIYAKIGNKADTQLFSEKENNTKY